MSAWGWPQWVALVMLIIGMALNIGGIFAASDADKVKGRIIGMMITATFVWVMWMGGFWS